MITIKSNKDLNKFITNLNHKKEIFAIRKKNKIQIFFSKKHFTKNAKTNKNKKNIQGTITAYNFFYFYLPF